MLSRRLPTLLILLSVCALTALSLGRGVSRVSAQGARIFVRVADESIAAGETTEVELVIENVASLWGGQIALRYDPALVQVVDAAGEPAEAIESGALLEAAQRTVFVNEVDAGAGRIEYAATLRNNPRRPVEPAGGSGVFARFRLEGRRGGMTALTFSTEGAEQVREILFVDGDLAPFSLPTVDGQLLVSGGGPAPIYLPFLTTPGAGELALEAEPEIRVDMAGWFTEDGAPAQHASSPARLLDDPELIVETRGRLVDLAVSDGYAYWTEGPAEFECEGPEDEARIARVNIATGVEETLAQSCDFVPGQLVVDDGSLCYVEVEGGALACMNAAPREDGATLVLFLTGGLDVTSQSPLAVDDSHLYWSDRDGIHRKTRGPGAPETLVAGRSPTHMLVDGGHVYWVEPATAGAYRVPVAGGTPETLYEDARGDWMAGIAVDGGHLYWTETGGVARRAAKTGGTPEGYGRTGSWLAGFVAADDTHVFWSDEVRLRRVPKDHSEAPEALALDFPGIRGLQTTDDALVWAGGRGLTGIWQIPLEASEVTVDLRINWIEVTQTVQNLVNDVPLVADKDTLVRVYPASDWAYTHDVPMVLHGRRGGAVLPGSPLSPIVPLVTVARDGAERERMDETFNFLLPEGWTEGTVALRAEINPGNAIPEANRTNNELTETVTFERRDAMCLEMISVDTVPSRAVARGDRFESIMAWVQAAYPVPGLRVRRGPTIYEPQVCFWHGLPYPCRGPYEMPDDSGWVLSRIWWHNVWTGNDPGCDTTFYVGMVHQDGIVRDGTIGSSYVGGRELWTMMDTDPEVLDGRAPWFLPFGGAIMAHELGHSLNRRHVDCGDPADDTIQPGYPYNRCDMGDDDPAGYYGMRLPDLALIAPTEAGDLMSYAHNDGKPEWPSDWTYRALMGGLPGDFAALDVGQGPERGEATGRYATTMTDTDALVASLAQTAESLAVTGVVSPTAGTAELLEIKRFPTSLVGAAKLAELASRVRVSPTGAYVLSLRDENDVVLRELRFDLPEEIDAYDEVRTFQLVLPYGPTTARIVLSEGGAERAARNVSANPPTVKLSSPNGGENVTGLLQVTWEAEDPDDDPLSYTLQYSPDAGTSWQPLALDIFTTTFTVEDMSTVPGSEQALVRVIAADGVHTAFDVSDATFRVARSAPEVTILRPHDGAVLAPERQIIAQGSAYDAEDGTLDGDALRWFADGEPVGRGAMVAIPALEPGEHTITLRAVDRDQQEGEASIRIHVQDLACENAEAVDVVFVLDTSPPMAKAFDEACALSKDVIAALQSSGLAVRYNVLGVTQRRGCATQMLRDVVKKTSVDHPADWGLAVRDLAQGYPWRPGAARLIVPISNQGPENGDPVEDPGADRKVIEAAIQAASRASVKVAPVLMLAGLGPQPEPPEMPVARSLALGTGGKLFHWKGQSQNIAGSIARLIPTGSCVPSVVGVSPACGFEPGATFTLHGENLAVDTQVWVGAERALGVEASADGRRLTFQLPPDLVADRSHDVRVERTGVGGMSLHGAITTGPCSARCDDYAPGDITAPMWRLREAQGELSFEARAATDELRVRLFAADGPVKLLIYAMDDTYLDGTPVPTGATRTVALAATPGTSYRIVVRNGHDPATRFRLYASGAEYLRTADDGDGWEGTVMPGSGEDHGAASHPELGFAERWSDLDPAFATTTWFFDVAPGESELAVRIWSEILYAYGHGGMSWIRPDGSVQPLVGTEPSGFDHTWRVADPMPGLWGLRIQSTEEYVPPVVVEPPDDSAPDIVYYYLDFPVQGYSLARLGAAADDWLYLLPNSMLGPPCGPTLLLRPVLADGCLGDVRRMDIVLADVANLYGAELHLSFDKEKLKAVDENGEDATQVTPGSMLDPRKGLVGANAVDNGFGLIDYAVSLKAPAPPAFGTGRLGSVLFEALAQGQAEITVDEVKLSERPLPPLPAVRLEADLRGAAWTLSSCEDGTGGTGGQGKHGALRGQVRLDGRVDHGGARVEVGGSGPYLSDGAGGYGVTGLPPGEHLVDLHLGGYLRAGPRAVTLPPGATVELPPVTLLGGDCDGSDRIDIVDGAISARFYGLSDGWAGDKQPDINADGVVDIFDLVMLGGNFGCAVEDTSERCRRWGR